MSSDNFDNYFPSADEPDDSTAIWSEEDDDYDDEVYGPFLPRPIDDEIPY